MFKIVLFLAFIVCTLGAPTEKNDHPAIVNVPPLVSTDDITKEFNSKTVKPTIERKYGEHVAKRDTAAENKGESKQTNTASSSKISSPLSSEIKKLPAVQVKSKRETHNPQIVPGSQFLPTTITTLESKNSTDNHKSKRELQTPQVLPAHSNYDDDKTEVLPTTSEPKISTLEIKSKRETKTPPQTLPSFPNDHNSKASTELKNSKTETKPKRETQTPQTLPVGKQTKEFVDQKQLNPTDKIVQPSNFPSHDHLHKREDDQPSVNNADKTKIIKLSEVKSSETVKDNKKEEKRDIPVSLTPSTSPQPQTTTTIKNENSKEKKYDDNLPLSAYSRPVPVAELFRHNPHAF